MPNLDKRIAVLEQAAKVQAAQPKPPTCHLTAENLERIVHEIRTRERSQLTQEEQIRQFREQVEEMTKNRESRVSR